MNMLFKPVRVNLLMKIIILISIVVCICMTLSVLLFSISLEKIIDQHFGEQALVVAKLVAEDKRIIEGFKAENPPDVIQPLAETIRELSGASYVVVGNREGIRYSHHNPDEIGKVMGTSNDEVFEENTSIIYQGIGVSGAATKAKTPIYDENGEIIGVSSVGFLFEHISEQVISYQKKVTPLFAIPLLLGIVGAYLVAKNIKNMIFGLEPEEISYLFKEKDAILESIQDATIAVDQEGRIVTVNKKAREEIFPHDHFPIGSTLSDPQIRQTLTEVLTTKSEQHNKQILLNNLVYVMDASPIRDEKEFKGAVFTFRLVSEVEQFAAEFTKIKAFAENMRAHNHEFLNKLNVIYGLLHLKQIEKAKQLISDEVKERQNLIAFLMDSVKDPLLAACLLGKVNKAREMKVSLDIEEESKLVDIPDQIDTSSLVTILSNVIDNALEAVRDQGSQGKVRVSFTDIGNDLIFDIDDNGPGIAPEQEKDIYTDGYTTKEHPNQGLGLAIVKQALEILQGDIFISTSDLGGARFSITIPKVKA